ncbi:hypothetical protein DOS84_13055 [Flavobacterium aquariorum]|uniref:Uncharacterized protein n=1 Tax=Flavobacterium aquariorum TaxID=2217670 RepID=A0A2W7TTQ4_9FLAO|nr:hypothetical protein [Flavobacterium aquariorum]PZX92796.1 hypothetical protein DOS84_13055 [Flavobacterium aquariorum]
MKAIDNKELQIISKVIIGSISTNGIYCFGEKRQTQLFYTPFQESVKQEEYIHLYLLVLAEETIENATNDICDKIKIKTQGRITTTLLIHQMQSLKKLCDDQKYFFWNIMQNADLLFQDANKPPYLIIDGIPKRNPKSTSLYVANRKNTISTIWNWVYNDDDISSSVEVKMCGLHQIVEQTCLALIRVFMGYTPNYFSLEHLFNLCAYFTTMTTDFFPHKTKQDQSLFKLLKQQPNTLRFSKANDVDYLYYELLEERCCKFKNQADELMRKELGKAEQIESVEGQTNVNK